MSSCLLHLNDLRALESSHAALPLMERAGHAAAKIAAKILGKNAAPTLVLAGPGNNGGDAFVVARLLRQQQRKLVLVFFGDTGNLPADARQARDQWLAVGGRIQRDVPAGSYALVIDGLFGIGLTRPITGEFAALIHRINMFRAGGGPVLALDIASGLDAESGVVHGVAVRASHTATFIAAKPGLYTLDGPDHSGAISVHDLNLAPTAGSGMLLFRDAFAAQLRPRQRNTHKGSHGSLAVIGGAAGMTGAALLAARAALMLGAGRTFCGLLQALAVDLVQPELMLRTPELALEQATALVIGPGLGQSDLALDLVRRIASADFSVLLDADALNLIAFHPVLAQQIARRSAPTLLTPHPAEAARLLGITTDAVQGDRIAAVLRLASRFNAYVALKGCGTVIALPDGRWWINTTGNPGLATGGTGDVLSGMAGALLAQSWPAEHALLAAVHLHGAAADQLVAGGHGPVGLTASELIPAARSIFNRWIEEPQQGA